MGKVILAILTIIIVSILLIYLFVVGIAGAGHEISGMILPAVHMF